MTKQKKPATLVRNQLLEIVEQSGEAFQAVLERYAMERLLFRLGETPHGKDFLLKGGRLLSLLADDIYRPTKDLDLLGRGDPSPDRLNAVFQAACKVKFPDDGMLYGEQIETGLIKEGQAYEGVRLKVPAQLGLAQVVLKIDVGFGDAVLLPYEHAPFKPILNLPAPAISAYPLESVMAEKLHAMLDLGVMTSRMKDIYDLHHLAGFRNWSGSRLNEAVQLTFTRRRMALPAELPVMFTATFYENPLKLTQWQAFARKVSHVSLGSMDLSTILNQLETFWWPLLQALKANQPFDSTWNPSTWRWES